MACSHPKKSTTTSFRGPYFLLEKVYSVERILNLNLFPGNDFLFQRMLTKIKLYKDSSSRLILFYHCAFTVISFLPFQFYVLTSFLVSYKILIDPTGSSFGNKKKVQKVKKNCTFNPLLYWERYFCICYRSIRQKTCID